jgi:hypothetical protein
MSAILGNAEKEARYRERHLGVDDAKVRIGSFSTPPLGRNWSDLHVSRYTLTALIENLVAIGG